MKIAMACRQFDLRGGSERVFYRTVEGLHARGHEVHLFCGRYAIDPPEGTIAHKVPSIPWPRTARLLSLAFLTPKLIARSGCDVSLGFDGMMYQDLFRSGGGAHKVYLRRMIEHSSCLRVLYYRTSPYHYLVPRLEKRVLGVKGSRRVIAVCQQVKTELMEAYGVEEEKIVVIPNGVDQQRFHPDRRRIAGKQVRKQLGIPASARVALFVGTGFKRKGLERLLRLWESKGVRDAYLLIVGNDTQLSQYRRRWQRDAVLFVGVQSSVEDYYAAADLLVLPSLQEAFGNVVLEGLAAGLPVITVAGVGAADELQGELAEGILRDPDDPEELKEKINRFLFAADWPELSHAARTVAEGYTWDRFFVRLEEQLAAVRRR